MLPYVLGIYSVKHYTNKTLQLVSGSVQLQKNTAKNFDATDGLLPNMKVRDSFTLLSLLMHKHRNNWVTFNIFIMGP